MSINKVSGGGRVGGIVWWVVAVVHIKFHSYVLVYCLPFFINSNFWRARLRYNGGSEAHFLVYASENMAQEHNDTAIKDLTVQYCVMYILDYVFK